MAKATRKKKKGQTPEELMRKHVSNKENVITEEDFKNLEVGVTPDNLTEEPLEIPDKKQRPKDEQKDHGTVTPWDVIAE